jgi:RNA polymerase sigma factor (sigma-70 family)
MKQTPISSLTANPAEWVARARQGDKAALEALVRAVQPQVYGLAIRMLWHPEDAKDATQDILIRVVTHLVDYRGESAFSTWVYRIAANTLISIRRGRIESQGLTFERFGEDLDRGLEDTIASNDKSPDEVLLLEEVKLGCTLGMLLCLDRPHRLAYILGEILDLDAAEAAQILEIASPTFRKRLSRARTEISRFMMAKCGLANPDNPCRCRRRVNTAIQTGRIDPARLNFATSAETAKTFPALLQEIRKLDNIRRAMALYRSHPQYQCGADFAAMLSNLTA